MKTNKLYKYINLLFRIIIGIGAIWYIYIELNDNYINLWDDDIFKTFQYNYLLIAVLLLFLNWGIETVKWQFVIKQTIKITWISAFKKIMTGITIGFITPNRIGEIPARAILLNDKENLKDLVVQTSVGAYSQLIVTILFGAISALFTLHLFEITGILFIKIFLILISCFAILSYFFQKLIVKLIYNIAYFKKNKILDGLSHYNNKELIYVLFLSIIRYIVFAFQFFIILQAFNFYFASWTEVLLIPLCFMVASIIPTILISEIGVRGSVALFVFGAISQMDTQILLASVLLWIINVSLPALIGLIYLKGFKIIKEN